MSDPDLIVNLDPDYTVKHVFSTDDVTGTFDGLTQGDVLPGDPSIVDFTADPTTTKEGVDLYPVNSEFGFIVTDFDGAVEKDFLANPEYEEGFVGDLSGDGGEQLGIVISDAPTDLFKTPAVLGTWLAGIGGSTVKASTEHYNVMANVLSDQKFPGDPDAQYALDDDLYVIGGDYDGQLVEDVIAIVGDVNGDGVEDIKDVLQPNESTITENIAASTDYSVTLKDDGKLLYRWGNTVKRPNDVRLDVEMDLPDEWTDPDADIDGLIPIFAVSAAELVTLHTITNNPNDQIRPEDFENEAAIGRLPSYEVVTDYEGEVGRTVWLSEADFYAGDGTFYPTGTILKDSALAEAAQSSSLAAIGALSADLMEGFTNAWYTTMDREPFTAVLDEDGEYIIGPRWRLQPDKYGQDLPSIVIPVDPSLPPPPTNDEVKYETGEDTQTVINLLDWGTPVAPLSISSGWQNNSGEVSENGLNMTTGFNTAFYIKGEGKPATLYSTELVMDYDEVTVHDTGDVITGTEENDFLVGRNGNAFTGGAGSDMFVMSYGVLESLTGLESSTVTDFTAGEDVIGLFDLGVTDLNFDTLVTQTVDAGNLTVSISGTEVVELAGVGEELELEDFMLVNRNVATDTATTGDDYLIATSGEDTLAADTGNDSVAGLDGDDMLRGNDGDDVLFGGDGEDVIAGNFGDDVLYGGEDDDRLYGGGGDDTLFGGEGDDLLNGGYGTDSLSGEDGADVFEFRALGESVHGDLRDVINDFVSGTDKVDLSATMTGLTWVGVGGVELYTGTAGEVRFNDAYERLYVDSDGDSLSDFSIDLTGVTALLETDLILA